MLNFSPIINKLRKGESQGDPYKSITENKTVKGQKVQLSEIPDRLSHVYINGMNEIYSGLPKANEFIVDYTNAYIDFNIVNDNQNINVSYTGIGASFFPASRIWTKENNGEVLETLQNIVDAGETAIENLGQVNEAIDNAETATINANNAAINANTKATLANDKAVLANNAAILANEKALLADTKATLANDKATLADTAATNATNITNTATIAENARVIAENERTANESIRKTNETNRVNRNAEFKNCGVYSETTQYKEGNEVSYNGSSYRAKINTLGNTPPPYPTIENTWWTATSLKGVDGSGGDMFKYLYDSNNDGIVNDSDKLGGQLPSYYQKKIFEQTTIPSSPITDDLWIDISTAPYILKRYNGSQWVDVGGSGTGNTQVLIFENEVILNAETSNVSIGITEFDNNTDFLMVHQNTTYIKKGSHYTINANGISIDKISGNWTNGTILVFTVFKNIAVEAPEYNGQYIINGSITNEKLSDDIKNSINEANTKATTVSDSLISHEANESAHGLGTGLVNTKSLTFGANTIKHTGKASVFPEINLTGKHYVNLLGKDGDCENTTKWLSYQAILSLDSTNKVIGANSIKTTVNADTGASFWCAEDSVLLSKMNPNKYYMLSGYLKNGNASAMYLQLYTNGTGNMSKVSSFVADTTKFTRVVAKIKPSDWGTGTTSIIAGVLTNGTTGQYSYSDGLMLNEISADDYNLTDDQLLAKYPYVESYGCLQNLYLENRRHNHVINGNGEEGIGYWGYNNTTPVNPRFSGGYFICEDDDAGFSEGYTQYIMVNSNTTYSYRHIYKAGTANARFIIHGLDSSMTTVQSSIVDFNTASTSDVIITGSFNTGSNTIYLKVSMVTGPGASYLGIAYHKECMIVGGATPPSAYKSCDLQRFVLEGKFTSDDKVKIKDGRLTGELWWKHKTLFGKDYDVIFNADHTGFKSIKLPITPYSYVRNSEIVQKYDGNMLSPVTSLTAADQTYTDSALSHVWITVSDADSGWTETINPNNDEAKLPLNGWKAVGNNGTRYTTWIRIGGATSDWMSYPDGSASFASIESTNATSVTVANVSPFKVGDKVTAWGVATGTITAIEGNSLTLSVMAGSFAVPVNTAIARVDVPGTDERILSWCKTNIAPNYPGYQLHYKCNSPELITDINVHVHGDLWSIVPGDNYVTVDSGIVLGEVASFVNSSGDYYTNNTIVGISSYFRNKADSICAVYKNLNYDTKAIIRNTISYGYGNADAQITGANYDTNATYTVDYQILKTLHAQSFSSLTLSYAQDVFSAISSIGKAVEQKQQHDSTLDTLVDLSMYEEFTIPPCSCRFGNFSSGILLNQQFVQFRAVKKAVPIISLSNMITYYYNGSGSIVIPPSDVQYVISSLTRFGFRMSAQYVGSDSTIRNALINNGGSFTTTIKADCRGRL